MLSNQANNMLYLYPDLLIRMIFYSFVEQYFRQNEKELFGMAYHTALKRVPKHLKDKQEIAKDLAAESMQSCFASIIKKPQNIFKLPKWIISIAKNKAIDFYRSLPTITYTNAQGEAVKRPIEMVSDRTLKQHIAPQSAEEREYLTKMFANFTKNFSDNDKFMYDCWIQGIEDLDEIVQIYNKQNPQAGWNTQNASSAKWRMLEKLRRQAHSIERQMSQDDFDLTEFL